MKLPLRTTLCFAMHFDFVCNRILQLVGGSEISISALCFAVLESHQRNYRLKGGEVSLCFCNELRGRRHHMKNEKSLMFPVIVSLNVVHKDEIYLCLCLKTIPWNCTDFSVLFGNLSSLSSYTSFVLNIVVLRQLWRAVQGIRGFRSGRIRQSEK